MPKKKIMIYKTKGIKMPRKKTEKLVHLDMEVLTQKEPLEKQESSSLGELLKTRRMKKKWEIEDVARKLRIKPIYLEALEQGHYYVFPARSYGIGFLRSYSKLLDLNSDEMISLFNQETTDIKEQPLDMLVMEKHFTLPSIKMVFTILFLICGVYFIWCGFAIHYYSVDSEESNYLNLVNKDETVISQVKEEVPVSSVQEIPQEEKL